MILVGCPPLEVEYVPEIVSRRLKNLQGEAREVFQRLLDNRADDEDMKRLPVVLEQADNYCIDKKTYTAWEKQTEKCITVYGMKLQNSGLTGSCRSHLKKQEMQGAGSA